MKNETALQIIDTAAKKGALICFDKANGFPTTELYRTEITQMNIDAANDCYEISKKFMPKKEIVDRIGEASGIVFVKGETKAETLEDSACGKRTVYTGVAQGKRRLSDGSWRMSSLCDYEFDPTLRAMLDYDVTELNEQTKRKQKVTREGKAYGPVLARAILEYQKVAKQRANTGARLRVIRELVGMPIAFTAEQVREPVLFGRIVQNTDYILQTPEGRAMATAQALGMDMSALFGQRKPALECQPETTTITDMDEPPEGEDPPPPEAATTQSQPSGVEPSFDDTDEPETTGKSAEFERLTSVLEEYMTYKEYLDVNSADGKNPYKLAQEELTSTTATEETRNKMIARIKKYLTLKHVPGVA